MAIILKKELLIKICFYLISLFPLFILLVILKVDLDSTFKDNTFSVIMGVLIILSSVGMFILNDVRKDSKNLPVKIIEISEMNYENLGFLATYIVPLVAIPLDTLREKIVFIILLLFIGIIFVTTNVYYTNPSLAVLGFNLYEISDEKGFHKKSIVIINGKLELYDQVKCLKISNNVYYCFKLK